jgi:tetratricopeptide (TPR) repeat protein
MTRPLFALALSSALLAGCISMPPRGVARPATASIIEGVPSERWGDNSCGSGALASILTHFGTPATEAELDEHLQKGRNGGVLSIDLVLEARQRGLQSHLLRGSRESVAASIREGNPVILMVRVLDAPGSSRDLFHYLLVDGVDGDGRLVRVQYGEGGTRWVPFERIERPWAATNYATLTFSPGAGERVLSRYDADLRRAVAAEQRGDLDEALAIYRRAVEVHPSPAVVWTNIGNAELQRGRTAEAEEAYRSALRADGGYRDAMNNLAWLLFEQQRNLDEAAALARSAADPANADRWAALDTLGHVEAARSRCDAAREAFAEALEAAPPGRQGELREARDRTLENCRPAVAKAAGQ